LILYILNQVSTLQASYLDKRVAVNSNTTVQLSIWDTAGQERSDTQYTNTILKLITVQYEIRFHALGPIYYRDASGALLVYDITDAESFNKVKNWVKELRKIVGSEIIIVIAGNKIDLEKNRHVNEEEAVRYWCCKKRITSYKHLQLNNCEVHLYNATVHSEFMDSFLWTRLFSLIFIPGTPNL